ncbi:MAG TPA: transcriptional regulator, partial [Actinopolymorphaceae bacterium]
DDRRLAELVGELSMKSPEFTALWSQHPVSMCTYGTKELHHPLVGPMTLSFDVLELPDRSGHRLLTYHAEPGSSSESALRLLAAAAVDARRGLHIR